MTIFKKTTIAIAALSSSAVFAGSMGPVCTSGDVTVPCTGPAWSAGIQALYLQPSYSGTNSLAGVKGTSFNGTDTSISNSVVSGVEMKPAWAGAFKLQAAYHLKTSNDLDINWSHLAHKTTSFYASINDTTTDGNNSDDNQITSIEPSWDVVNLEFGQHVYFGERKKIRFHGGVEYVHINNNLTANTSSSTTSETSNGTFFNKNTYNGFGPRIGADMSYAFSNHWEIYANGATAILTGTSQNSTNVSTSTNQPSNPPPQTDNISFDFNRSILVPELEAKLGFSYMHNLGRGNLSIDAGYMWINYFNSQMSFESKDAATVSDSNFALQGPFLGLKWLGNI